MNTMLKHIASMLHLPATGPGPGDPPEACPVGAEPSPVPIPHVTFAAVAGPVMPSSPGRVLRPARLQQGVSIRGLATFAGVSISSVVRAEAMDGTGVRTSMHDRLIEALARMAADPDGGATVKSAGIPERIPGRMPLPPLDTDDATTAQRALKGAILRELRHSRALTVTQVCSALNITQGHLRMLEAGEVERHLPYDRAIALVASAFPFGGRSR